MPYIDLVKVYTDGACRGNPGSGAIGVLILDREGNFLEQYKETIGYCTNNVAEYTALKKGLDMASKYTDENLAVFSDSKLVTHQMKGEWRIKEAHLRKLFNDAKKIEARFKKVVYNHLPRSNTFIKQVDRMANDALDGV
jgi:ribonuclease HI